MTALVLEDALAALSACDRELLALRYGADLRPREIARLLDRRTNTVDVALSRARARLAAALEARTTRGTHRASASSPISSTGPCKDPGSVGYYRAERHETLLETPPHPPRRDAPPRLPPGAALRVRRVDPRADHARAAAGGDPAAAPRGAPRARGRAERARARRCDSCLRGRRPGITPRARLRQHERSHLRHRPQRSSSDGGKTQNGGSFNPNGGTTGGGGEHHCKDGWCHDNLSTSATGTRCTTGTSRSRSTAKTCGRGWTPIRRTTSRRRAAAAQRAAARAAITRDGPRQAPAAGREASPA